MYSNSLGGSGARPPPPSSHHAHHSQKGSQSFGTSSEHLNQYPNKITYTLSALKTLCGIGLVVLGVLALYHKASYARSVSGLWGGIIIIISGVLGAFTVRHNASRGYILVFFVSCVLALIADVLVVIYSATGLARDSGYPGGFVRDEVTGELIPVSQVNIPAREKAMLVNLLLIILGVLDIILTLPCFIICLREVCECYTPGSYTRYQSSILLNEHGARNDWLMSWLGQQNQIYFSGGSGMPYHKIPAFSSPHTASSYVFLPSDHSHTSSKRYNYHSSHQSSPRESSHSQRSSRRPHQRRSGYYKQQPQFIPAHFAAPLEIYANPHTFYYPAYPSPGSNQSLAPIVPVHSSSPHQWIYGDMNTQMQRHYRSNKSGMIHPTSRLQRPRKRSRTDDSEKVVTRNMRKNPKAANSAKTGVTDSDLEKTYTGLDRELAEEFIEQTMDPAMVLEHRKAAERDKKKQQFEYSPNMPIVNNNNNNNTSGSEAW